MNLHEIKEGDKVVSTGGTYYHIVKKIASKKHLGMGDFTVPVFTECYSQTGRFVANDVIFFNENANGDFIANHIN